MILRHNNSPLRRSKPTSKQAWNKLIDDILRLKGKRPLVIFFSKEVDKSRNN